MFVKEPFPYILTRQEVIRRDVCEYTPIETSINNIEDRMEKMEIELTGSGDRKPDNNNIMMLIQGSVVPQVNVGVVEVAKVFLGKKSSLSNNNIPDSENQRICESTGTETQTNIIKGVGGGAAFEIVDEGNDPTPSTTPNSSPFSSHPTSPSTSNKLKVILSNVDSGNENHEEVLVKKLKVASNSLSI